MKFRSFTEIFGAAQKIVFDRSTEGQEQALRAKLFDREDMKAFLSNMTELSKQTNFDHREAKINLQRGYIAYQFDIGRRPFGGAMTTVSITVYDDSVLYRGDFSYQNKTYQRSSNWVNDLTEKLAIMAIQKCDRPMLASSDSFPKRVA